MYTDHYIEDNQTPEAPVPLPCTHSDPDWYEDPITGDVGLEYCTECGATSNDAAWHSTKK